VRSGWRALKGTVTEMTETVKESLENLHHNDIVIALFGQFYSSYMSRTDDGGDLPIRQFNNRAYQVDGELIYSGKEKQYHLFKLIMPILQLLQNRKVIFMVPILRYVVMRCCESEEHVTNRSKPGYEE